MSDRDERFLPPPHPSALTALMALLTIAVCIFGCGVAVGIYIAP